MFKGLPGEENVDAFGDYEHYTTWVDPCMYPTDVSEDVNLKSVPLDRLVLMRGRKSSMLYWEVLHVGVIAHSKKSCEAQGLVLENKAGHLAKILLKEMGSIYLFQQLPKQLPLTS